MVAGSVRTFRACRGPVFSIPVSMTSRSGCRPLRPIWPGDPSDSRKYFPALERGDALLELLDLDRGAYLAEDRRETRGRERVGIAAGALARLTIEPAELGAHVRECVEPRHAYTAADGQVVAIALLSGSTIGRFVRSARRYAVGAGHELPSLTSAR